MRRYSQYNFARILTRLTTGMPLTAKVRFPEKRTTADGTETDELMATFAWVNADGEERLYAASPDGGGMTYVSSARADAALLERGLEYTFGRGAEFCVSVAVKEKDGGRDPEKEAEYRRYARAYADTYVAVENGGTGERSTWLRHTWENHWMSREEFEKVERAGGAISAFTGLSAEWKDSKLVRAAFETGRNPERFMKWAEDKSQYARCLKLLVKFRFTIGLSAEGSGEARVTEECHMMLAVLRKDEETGEPYICTMYPVKDGFTMSEHATGNRYLDPPLKAKKQK